MRSNDILSGEDMFEIQKHENIHLKIYYLQSRGKEIMKNQPYDNGVVNIEQNRIQNKTLLHVRGPLGNNKRIHFRHNTQYKESRRKTESTKERYHSTIKNINKTNATGKTTQTWPNLQLGQEGEERKLQLLKSGMKEGMLHQAHQNRNVLEVLTLNHHCPQITRQILWESPGRKQTLTLLQEETQNLNRSTATVTIKYVILKLPTEKSPGPDTFTWKFYHICKEQTPVLHSLFHMMGE